MDEKETLPTAAESETGTPAVETDTVDKEKVPDLKISIKEQKTKPVIFYIVVMFAVALFLIILSFFMQQRNHETLLKGLSTSADQVQSIVDLELEKDKLSEDLDKIKSELSKAQEEQKKLKEGVDTATKQASALEYLMQARMLSDSDRHQARSVLDEMQKKGLADSLPTTSSLPNQASPKQQYDDLLNLLSK